MPRTLTKSLPVSVPKSYFILRRIKERERSAITIHAIVLHSSFNLMRKYIIIIIIIIIIKSLHIHIFLYSFLMDFVDDKKKKEMKKRHVLSTLLSPIDPMHDEVK